MNSQEKPKKFIGSKILAYLMMSYGVIFAVSGVADLLITTGTSGLTGAIIGLVIGGPLGFFGYKLFKKSTKKAKLALKQYYETMILRLAREQNGLLNIIETSIILNLEQSQTEEILNQLVTEGHATPQVNESGYIEYSFPIFNKTP